MQFEYSQKWRNDQSEQQQCQCHDLNSKLTVRINMSLYIKELIPYLHCKLIRIVQSTYLRSKTSNVYQIGYKDAMIYSKLKETLIKYNTFSETAYTIKQVILKRAKQDIIKTVQFDKKMHQILVKYHQKKKLLSKSKQNTISTKSNYISGFSNVSSNKQILKGYDLKEKYNFKPVSPLQSKDSSTIMMQKLTRNLSIMVEKVETKGQNFPQISEKMFKCFDIRVPKEQVMFKKHLSNNFSEINEQKKLKKASSTRLMTNQPQPLASKFQQAYGFQFQNCIKVNKPKKKKSKSLIRKQANQKSLTRITQNLFMKENFRINTNQDSTRISSSKSKSKSNSKTFSKSKLIASGKLTNKVKKSDKSLTKSRTRI